MSKRPVISNINHILLAGVAVISIAVFLVDIQFPLGVSGGIPYVLLVMATYWHERRRYTVAAGVVATLLIVAGFFLSESSEYRYITGTNRAMAIVVIWAAVWFVNNYKMSLAEKEKGEKRISALFEASTEGIIITDLNGTIVMVNEKIEDLFGYPRKKLVGRQIEILLHPKNKDARPDYWQLYYEKNANTRQIGLGHDLYGVRKNGEKFPVEITLNFFKTDEGRFVISYINDITDRKAAEDQLLKAHRELKKKALELKQSNDELEQFAYVASHDLQEPLRMVASYTQLLARRYKNQLDEDANDFIEYAVDGAQRMQQLLNDLLQFSRVGTKAKPFKPLHVMNVVDKSLRNLEKYIEENDADIKIESELPVLAGDNLQLIQLFQNLIHNAIKFTDHNHTPRVRINAKEYGDHWQFSVSDNGVGIDKQHEKRIFMIFQRLHNHDKYDGSGIGLAICKKIVERHEGDIWLDSIPGEGTTFYFTIAKGLETANKGRIKDVIEIKT